MSQEEINEKYQKWIQIQFDWLSENTSNIDNIRIFACDGILSPEDDREIRDHCGSEEEKFRIFYQKVKNVGFSQINVLIRALRENNQEVVATEFERFKTTCEDFNAGQTETDGLGIFGTSKKDFIDFTDGLPLEVKVKVGKSYMDQNGTYRMRSNPKGLALIISNEIYLEPRYNRQGGDKDRYLMTDLLRQLGYEVHQAVNVHSCRLAHLVNEFKGRLISRQVDSCVVVIMGHGKSNKLFMSDQLLVNIYPEIIYKFDNKQCPQFLGKPKIFIVQACQDFEVVNSRLGTDSEIPLVSDMLICFSTIPGYVAYRHTVLGSLYANCLAKIFMENAHDMEIRKMLHKIGIEMTKLKCGENLQQVSFYQEILFGDFFFNPEPNDH